MVRRVEKYSQQHRRQKRDQSPHLPGRLRTIFEIFTMIIIGWLGGLNHSAGAEKGQQIEPIPESSLNLQDKIEAEIRQVALEQQERSRRSEEQTSLGYRMLEARRYEAALELFRDALSLNPENERAKMGKEEAERFLEARPEPSWEAIPREVKRERIAQQAALAEAENDLAAAERDIQQALSPLEEKDDKKRAEQYVKNLELLDQAEQKLARARLRLESLSARYNTKAQKERLSALQAQVIQSRPKLHEELAAIQRKIALREVEQNKAIQAESEKQKRDRLLEEALMHKKRFEYGKAEEILLTLREMDRSDSEVEKLLQDVRRLKTLKRQEVVRDRVVQSRLNDMLRIEQAAIAEVSPENRLRYPKDWDILVRKKKIGTKEAEVEETTQQILKQLEERITVEFEETSLRDILNFLKQRTSVNILYKLEDAVADQPISLRLHNVRLETALKWLMRQTNLGYDIRRGAIFISEKETIEGDIVTEVYDVRDIASAVTHARKMPEQGDEEEETEEEKGIEATIDLEGIIRRVLPDDFAREGATVGVEGGTLTVTNTRETQSRILDLLGKLRSAYSIQIAIAARYLQIRDDFWEEFASNFYDYNNYYADESPSVRNPVLTGSIKEHVYNEGRLSEPLGENSNYLDAISPAGVPTNSASHVSTNWFQNPNWNPGKHMTDLRGSFANGTMQGLMTVFGQNLGTNPLLRTPGADSGLSFHIKELGWLNQLQAQWFLRMVQETAKADELFTPHLVCYNNRYAWIRRRERIPIIENWRRAAAGDGMEPVITYINDGASLQVRPTVSADKRFVTIDIFPRIDQVTRPMEPYPLNADFLSTSSAQTNTAQRLWIDLPEILRFETRTFATVPDGGAILLSGLGAAVTSQTRRGLPLAQDLPVIGNLFSNRANQKERRNYVMLINAKMILLDEEEARQTR